MSTTDLSLYAGRWVAITAEQVSGVGHTGPEALQAARRNRPKAKDLAVHYVEPAGGEPLALSPLLDKLQPIFAKLKVPIYLVGGAVRDAVLGRASKDLDFAVPSDAIKIAFKVGDLLNAPAYALDKERGIGRVVLADEGTALDFARFRGESLETDLRDRDFTINAMALPAAAKTSASIVDPFAGKVDLQNRLVQRVHDQSLADDPIRGLRAVRIAVRLGFALDEATALDVLPAVAKLHTTSAERARDEWFNLMRDKPHLALKMLDELGALELFLPHIARLNGVEQTAPHYEDVFHHTLSVLRYLPLVEDVIFGREAADDELAAELFDLLEPYQLLLRDHLQRRVSGDVSGGLLLRIAALYHDVGKSDTQTREADGRIRFFKHDKVGATIVNKRLDDFHLSREARQHVKQVVDGHMRPLLLSQDRSVSSRAIFRFCRKYSSATLDILLLSLADHLATYDGRGELNDSWERLLTFEERTLAFYRERFLTVTDNEPLLTGDEIMDHLGIPGSPEVGRLLRLLKEAQAVGEVSTREEALLFVTQSHG